MVKKIPNQPNQTKPKPKQTNKTKKKLHKAGDKNDLQDLNR